MNKPNMFDYQISIAVLVLSLLLAGCDHKERQNRIPPRPVKVFRVGDGITNKAQSFAGEVRPRYESPLSFRVAGKILSRTVDVGDTVRKGQLLARLDAKDYRLGVQALKSQLKAAQAEMEFAKDDLVRYQELLNQQVISQPEYDRHQTNYTTIADKVKTLEAQLGQTANQLEYTDLKADSNGVITALNVEIGQVVTSGQPILKLARLDEKEVQIDLPEDRVSGIHLREEVEVSLWAQDDRRIKARIREITPSADSVSRTYRVKATLLDSANEAWLGMTASVWLSSHPSTMLSIPLSAVFTPQHIPGQKRVWVVDNKAGTVKSMPVHVVKITFEDRIEVSGIDKEEIIVSAGVHRLSEGQAVRVLGDDLSVIAEQADNNKGKPL